MDFYDLLGVRRNASVADIRRAYQKRARELHPDLNPGDPLAAKRFRLVADAFAVLSDPHRRAAYDRGDPPPIEPSLVRDVGFEGFDFSAELRMGVAGFRDLFGSALAKGGSSRGEDLEQTTRITFEESLTGARRRIHVVRQDACPVCAGQGDVAFGPVSCPRCHGAGTIRASRRHMIFTRRCPDCGATGVLTRRPCERCSGQGRILQSEWMEVEIPAGAADGSRVRVPGCGNAGPRAGPPGDLVLGVTVEPHPFFRREGDDLHCTVPVSMTEAALGGHIEVPTPNGPVSIEIPAGTQTGQRFRLRKRGMPRVGEKGSGDLYVEARIVIQRVTDDKSRELLREFARLNVENPRKDLAALHTVLPRK